MSREQVGIVASLSLSLSLCVAGCAARPDSLGASGPGELARAAQPVVSGDDDRIEAYAALSDPNYRARVPWLDGVVAIVPRSRLKCLNPADLTRNHCTDTTPASWRVDFDGFVPEPWFDFCPGEFGAGDPQGVAEYVGVLVAPTLVLTEMPLEHYEDFRVVFNYFKDSADQIDVVNGRDVFKIDHVFQEPGKHYGVLVLARAASHIPARFHASSAAVGSSVFAVGTPLGMPLKIAPGHVTSLGTDPNLNEFESDCDTDRYYYRGSPIFDMATGLLVGLVTGDTSEKDGDWIDSCACSDLSVPCAELSSTSLQTYCQWCLPDLQRCILSRGGLCLGRVWHHCRPFQPPNPDLGPPTCEHSRATNISVIRDTLISWFPNETKQLQIGDADRDGVPNDIDVCPCDEAEYNPKLQLDEDGVCQYCRSEHSGWDEAFCRNWCKTAQTDNCPNRGNTNQENSNAAWEADGNAQRWGDACDPVPLPKIDIVQTSACREYFGPGWGRECISWVSSFRLATLASYYAPGRAAPPAPYSPYLGLTIDKTEFRFCLDNDSPTHPRKCTKQRDERELARSHSRAEESRYVDWHRITIEHTQFEGMEGELHLLRYDSAVSDPLVWKDWDVDRDLRDWSSMDETYPQPAPPWAWPSIGSSLGTLWAHQDSGYGQSVDIGSGNHETATHNDWLRNVTMSFHPWFHLDGDRVLSPSSPERFGCNRPGCKGISISPLYAPSAANLLQPETPVLGRLEPFEQVQRERFSFLLVRAVDDGKVAIIGAKAVPIIVESSDRLGDLIASDLVWAAPSEVYPAVGFGNAAPAALAVSPDGSRLAEVLYFSGNALAGSQELLQEERFPGNLGQKLAAEVASAETVPGGPRPRSDFRAVYSRAEATVWLVGGHDDDGQPAQEIWSKNLISGNWTRLPDAALAPGDVIDATYNWDTRRLWILDRNEERVRLWSRSECGDATLIADFVPAGNFTEHFLRIDSDGRLNIVCSRDDGDSGAYSVLLLQTDGQFAASNVVQARGLAMMPLFDQYGVTFLTTDKDGNLKGDRRERIDLVTADLDSIAPWF